MTLTSSSSSTPLDYRGPKPDFVPNDPQRIRGQALRRSLFFNYLTWIPGSFFVVATTGVAYVELGKFLGADDFLFSLIAAASLVATLGQLPGSLAVDWLRNRKKIYIFSALPARILYIVIGLLPWFVPRNVAWPAMLMALLIFLSAGLSNFGFQAWINWVADLAPERIRGKYIATCSRLGIAVAAATGLAVATLLDLTNQSWFNAAMAPVTRFTGLAPLIFLASVSFIAAGAFGILDPLSFLKVDEPPLKITPHQSLLHRLAKPLRDKVFRRYVAYWSFWNIAVGFMNWLWFLYILEFFADEKARGSHAWWVRHPYLAAVLFLPLAYQLGQFLGYPIWGRAINRFGRKPVLFISSTVSSLFLATWIFLSPALVPFLLVNQFFGGLFGSGQDIASFNMMLHFNRRGGPGYQAFASIAFSLAGALGALAAGTLAAFLQNAHWQYTFAPGTPWEHTFSRYAPIVAIGIFLKYAGDLVLLPLVKDSGEKPAAHAFRFVIITMYGNLNTLLITPLRSGAQFTRRWWR